MVCWFNTSSKKAPKVFIWGNICEAGRAGAEELAESSDGLAIWPPWMKEKAKFSQRLLVVGPGKLQNAGVLLKLCPRQRTLHLPGTAPLKRTCCIFSLARAPCGRVASLQHPWWISRHSSDGTLAAKRGLELCSHSLDQQIWKALDTSNWPIEAVLQKQLCPLNPLNVRYLVGMNGKHSAPSLN